MQARYYDPLIGRFLSIDPVGFSPSQPFMFGRYTYVGNDPINGIDPFGLEVQAYYSPSNGRLLMYDLDTRAFATSNNWFTGLPGRTVSQERGPVPAGTYSILERGGNTPNGYRWYRLEANDGNFGDDSYKGRTEIRLHPGNTSYGCVTCAMNSEGKSPEYEKFDDLLQNTATGTAKVDRKGKYAFGRSETVTDYGTLGVLPDGLSLNFNNETGEFRIKGELSAVTGSLISRDVDVKVCTVNADEGTCN